MSNTAQRSFASGELAPALYARTDQAKYATGLRTCRNFFVQRHGGVATRPGTTYIAPTKYAARTTRLVRFAFSPTQTYVIELGHQYARFVQNGGQLTTSLVAAWLTATAYTQGDLVTDGGVTYYCTVAHTSGATTEPGTGANWQSNWYELTGNIYEIPTPYQEADLMTLQVVQSNDVLTIVHPNYAPSELARYADTRWVLTPIGFGPSISAPSGLALTGGIAGADIWYAVTAVTLASGEESLPTTVKGTNKYPDAGTPTIVTWNPVMNALEYRVYRALDGATFGFIGTAGGQPSAQVNTTWSSTSANIATLTTGSWVVSGSQARITVFSASPTSRAFDGQYRVRANQTVTVSSGTTPSGEGRVGIYYSRDAETRVFWGYAPVAVQTGAGGATVAIDQTIAVPDNGYSTLVIDLVPEVQGLVAGATVTCSVDASASPTNQVDWNAAALRFSDAKITPDFGTAPPAQASVFATVGNYPSAVGYYQQRLYLANTTNDPEKVWGSRTGSFHSFTRSTPLADDDSVSFRLAGNEVSRVQHLVQLGKLIEFTETGEWVLEGDQAGAITPTSLNPRQIANNGAASLRPCLIDNAAVYVQARGTIVRDLVAQFAYGYYAYQSQDLSLFSVHLFEGYTLTDWAYAQIPHSVVWAVRSDGTLLSLTYLRDQQVAGWARHDTDGTYENVVTVSEGAEDVPYVVVKRTVNGSTVRYIERMASRLIPYPEALLDAITMDCALTYDGRNTTAETMTLSGGTVWDETETLTITRSVGGFVSGNVNDAIVFTDNAGVPLRVTITGYTSGTIVTGRADRTVPAELRTTATSTWSRAAKVFTGLSHLEGKTLAIVGDGFVIGSPNNPTYPTYTVSGGSVTLDRPYSVVHAGLAFVSDFETLDLDTAQGPSLKERKLSISRVGLMLQASRGVWAGRSFPTGTSPIQGLQELKIRAQEAYTDPVSLYTGDVQINIETSWDSNGRIVVRQVDPLPLTILSAIPMGFLPPTN